MKRLALFAGGAVLALTSALVVAQDAPESLLPPGFDRPKPSRQAPAPSRPADPAPAGGSVSVPVVQAVPGAGAAAPGAAAGALPNGVKVPTLKELEAMSPDELDQLLGLKPHSDMPAAARRPWSTRARAARCARSEVARTWQAPVTRRRAGLDEVE